EENAGGEGKRPQTGADQTNFADRHGRKRAQVRRASGTRFARRINPRAGGCAIPGHWKGDLIGGTKNSHIATLAGRHSRFTALVKVRSKDTAAVVAALSRQIHRLPISLRRSLTWDRGLEMAKHKTFTVATNVKVYFCDPHSSWQRGTNENTNRLLRQYLPKRTDLSGYTQSQPVKIALRLNQRPRKTLGFQTPASKLRASIAPTL
ncbi:MAG: IS30 family transposase, partial [Candidatus Acidiferrales bacterium]